MEALNELVDFLGPDNRLDVKSLALHHVLSLTGSYDGRHLLVNHPKVISSILVLAFKKDEQKAVSKDAFFTLINISSNEVTGGELVRKNPYLVGLLLDYVMDETSQFADVACAILSNLSRGKKNCDFIAEMLLDDKNNNKTTTTKKFSLEKLLKIFCTEKFNATNTLDYLSPFICNLTQLESIRNRIVSDKMIILRLLPYTTYKRSIIRRGGIIGSIKNLCFNYDHHEMFLFTPDIDLLSRLLLPIAGPEEFDADEMNSLPDDLQFLPPDKERESDPDIRNMILETLMMLCSRQKCRKYLKEKNAYLIIRELHKWEKDERVDASCEKLVQILIGDEPERGMENLHEISVPEDLSQKFYDYDKKELEKNFVEDVVIDEKKESK